MLPSSGQGQATDASTQAALSRILEGTSGEIGVGFFRALVQVLAAALGTATSSSPGRSTRGADGVARRW
jgi:hypothetical protein